eukprot:116589-Pyramimonas_sp.AAC.2
MVSRDCNTGERHVTSPGVDCRPANGSLSTGNVRRIFSGIFEIPCAKWYTSVDSRRPSTVELKSEAFLAVDSGAWRVSVQKVNVGLHACFPRWTE